NLKNLEVEMQTNTQQNDDLRGFYSDMKLYLSSILRSFAAAFCQTILPYHQLFPLSFFEKIPELLEELVTLDVIKNSNVFLLCCIMANSCLMFKEVDLSNEFHHKAETNEPRLRQVYDISMACAYIHCGYYALCNGKNGLAFHYAQVAKN